MFGSVKGMLLHADVSLYVQLDHYKHFYKYLQQAVLLT